MENYNIEKELEKKRLLEEKGEIQNRLKEIDERLKALGVGIELEETTGIKKNEIRLESNEVKFFSSKYGKVLQRELPNSINASFKIFNIKGDRAEFEYCGGITNLDFFEDVARFKNNPYEIPNRTKIVTTKPGVVRKDNNNNWEVEEVVEIEFFGS